MKFCDKLAKQRKNNNLSQEQLADKLGVSRQAVSKWEQGTSYPDMDKIISMCKILNCNLDDLIEDGIIEGKSSANKINFNNYFNDFLNFITKSYNMFWSMKFKEKIKCLFELFITFLILIISGLVIYFIVDDLFFDNFMDVLGINFIIQKLISPIFILSLIVIGIIIFLHLFKIRYLDYFITVYDSDVKEKIKEKALEEEKVVNNKKYIIEKPKEKIVIRDPKHSTFNFFNVLGKIILYILKFFIFILMILAIFFTIALIAIGAIWITFIKYGDIFIYLLITIIGLVCISFIIINFLYNFIFNRATKLKLNFILFIISLIFIGVGLGISTIKFMNYDYVTLDKSKLEIHEKIIPMKDNIVLPHNNINYIIDNNQNDIKLKIYLPKNTSYTIYYNKDQYEIYHIYMDNLSIFDMYNITLNELKENKIIDYDKSFIIDVYISEKNYEIIKENIDNYYGY